MRRRWYGMWQRCLLTMVMIVASVLGWIVPQPELAAQAGACPTHVWEVLEKKPFLNRFDDFGLNQVTHQCQITRTYNESLIIKGGMVLPGASYVMENDILVEKGSLTIDGGTVSVQPQIGWPGVYAYGGTSLHIVGTSFSGSRRGSWGGIVFWKGSRGSLQSVHVANAGGIVQAGPSNSDGQGGLAGAIYVRKTAHVTIMQTSVTNSGSDGYYFECGADVALSGDSAIGSKKYPAEYTCLPASGVLGGLPAMIGAGNGSPFVESGGGTVTGVLRLPSGGLRFHLSGPVTVNAHAQFEVDGTTTSLYASSIIVKKYGTLSVGPGAHLALAYAMVVAGTANIIGSSMQPVLLSGVQKQPGSWAGVAFLKGGKGTISGVRIADGGANTFVGARAGLYLASGTTPHIDHTLVTDSQNVGILIDGKAKPVLFADTVRNSGGEAVEYTSFPSAGVTLGGPILSGTGNHPNRVVMPAGSLSGVMTIYGQGLGTEIYCCTLVVKKSGRLVVGKGVDVRVGGAIEVVGTVLMTGTAHDPITVEGVPANIYADGPASSWAGIAFLPRSRGGLWHVRLVNAGQNPLVTNDVYSHPSVGQATTQAPAALYIGAGASPAIHATVVDSAGPYADGIVLDGQARPSLLGDLVINSGKSGKDAVLYTSIPSAKTTVLGDPAALRGWGNGYNTIYVPAGTISTTVRVASPITAGSQLDVVFGGAYSPLTIAAGGSLDIAPNGHAVVFGDLLLAGKASVALALGGDLKVGGRIVISPSAQLSAAAGVHLWLSRDLAVSGHLSLLGTAAAPVRLLTYAWGHKFDWQPVNWPYSGNWEGIGFWGHGTGVLTHVSVTDAGSWMCAASHSGCENYSTGIYVAAGSGPISITHSYIGASGGSDVEVGGSSHLILTDNSFGAVPPTTYGVLNDAGKHGTPVDARQNWWGAASGPAGVGHGKGALASAGVHFAPWLTHP